VFFLPPFHAVHLHDYRFSHQAVKESAFNSLNRALTFAPLLARPDYKLPFNLQTDARNKEHVRAYAFRAFTAAEKKYSGKEK
jgi:hypothetical protein